MDKIEKIDKSLEEAAETHVKNKYSLTKLLGAEIREAVNDFIAGAEWQASQMPMPEDTVLFNKGVAEGRRLEREDMLKDAVEGGVTTNGFYPYEPCIVASYPNCPYAIGDNVRIVVLKEEKE